MKNTKPAIENASPRSVPDPGLPPDWVQDAVFYQIFPDRFRRSQDSLARKEHDFQPWGSPPSRTGFQGGDLDGIREKLDYLQELGVTALYLNPVFASAANHRYHTYDYYAVDPLLGGNDALRRLLDDVHARGMRLILDAVFNHVGRGFWAFHHVCESMDQSPYRDWFLIRGYPLRPYTTPEAGNCNYEAWWGLPDLPKLNVDNPAVQDYLLDVARHWIDFGIDGWRLDVPEEIGAPGFWERFRAVVKEASPDAYIVGELWDTGHGWLDGDRCDGITNYELGRLALGFFARESLPAEGISISGYEIPRLEAPALAGRLEKMLKTHAWEFALASLNYLDSHDMPRIHHLAGGDTAAVRLMLAFQMTMPGTPIIYYGTEVGLTGAGDPECRKAFPWHQPETWDRDLLAHVQWLVRLRREHEVLRRGHCIQLRARNSVLAFKRTLYGGIALVIFNAGHSDTRVQLANVGGTARDFALTDARDGSTVHCIDGRFEPIPVPPRDVRILVGREDRQPAA